MTWVMYEWHNLVAPLLVIFYCMISCAMILCWLLWLCNDMSIMWCMYFQHVLSCKLCYHVHVIPMRYRWAMYDNNENNVMHTHVCLIGKLCHENDGIIIFIITLYNFLNHGISCMLHITSMWYSPVYFVWTHTPWYVTCSFDSVSAR